MYGDDALQERTYSLPLPHTPHSTSPTHCERMTATLTANHRRQCTAEGDTQGRAHTKHHLMSHTQHITECRRRHERPHLRFTCQPLPPLSPSVPPLPPTISPLLPTLSGPPAGSHAPLSTSASLLHLPRAPSLTPTVVTLFRSSASRSFLPPSRLCLPLSVRR